MNLTARTYVALGALSIFFVIVASAHAADISGVSIASVSTSTATINWSTSVSTDATVHYGLDPSVGIARDPTQASTHSVTLTDLEPGTTYHFEIESTDAQGNTSATAGMVFTTGGSAADKINAEISKVTSSADLSSIAAQVQQTASSVEGPPTISGSPKVVPDTNGATVTWQTDRASNSQVSLAPAQGFSGSYSITQGNPNESVTDHSVSVIGLQPSTEYHFQVSSTDALGLTGKTPDDTFTTKSILPKVANAQISNISDTVATVSWNTGSVLASGNVVYTNTRTKKALTMGDPVFVTKHSIELTGLELGTKYTVVIDATNQGGDDEKSSTLSFVTVRDSIPPVISNVQNESTLYPSDDVKIQTIISWNTDKPSSCQMFYTQGVATNPGATVESLPVEANPVVSHTEVIVGLSPSTVYSYWMQCHDVVGNQAKSDNFVLITPTKEQNIVDLILQNFQGTFGWVNNIGK